MNKSITLLITILSCTLLWSQGTDQNKNFKSPIFDCDCETDFFSINDNGVIHKWSIVNNTVTGGTVVSTGGSIGGLSFCGPDSARTFYSGNHPANEIRYYDFTSGWTTVPTTFQALNNGGFRNDQYYMGYSGGLNSLHHYDGTNFTLVANFSPEEMTVKDIAVDTLGQAWVFVGNPPGNTTQLRVYNKNGLVTSYTSVFSAVASYGAFFLSGQLYLAMSSHKIIPVDVFGTTAALGPAIPFPYNGIHFDIASCHCLPVNQPPPCQDLTPTIYILPGNISGASVVSVAVRISEVGNLDTDGFPIRVRVPSDPRLLFVWDIGLTSAAFIPVQNSEWNYLGNTGVFHNWVYNGPGQVLPAGSTSAFGFQAFYDPQSTSGETTITATIIPFSGGECNVQNNVDSEKLVYFD